MKYDLRTTERFNREFKKLDKHTQKNWIVKNLGNTENLRAKGKALTNNLKGKWRYRIEDYRLICEIKDEELIILAISVGHRSKIYI